MQWRRRPHKWKYQAIKKILNITCPIYHIPFPPSLHPHLPCCFCILVLISFVYFIKLVHLFINASKSASSTQWVKKKSIVLVSAVIIFSHFFFPELNSKQRTEEKERKNYDRRWIECQHSSLKRFCCIVIKVSISISILWCQFWKSKSKFHVSNLSPNQKKNENKILKQKQNSKMPI